jgi:putative DNA primase/helicase
MKIYSWDKIKASGDCIDYAITELGLQQLSKSNGEVRFNCPWRTGSDSGSMAITKDVWFDHVEKVGGSIIDLAARAQFGGDVWKAAEHLGERLNVPVFSELKGEKNTKKATILNRKIEKIYQYKDLAGNVIHETVRFIPKCFKQRRPDPDKPGKYIWSLKDITPILYRISDWIDKKYVVICEGEKDCDNLLAINIPATTNAMGAEKWLESYNKVLTGKSVVIIPDNDEPGRRHASLICFNLKCVAKDIRIINLPDLPDKGDVSNWLSAGGTREKLLELIKTTQPVDLSKIKAPEKPKKVEHVEQFTDLWNCRLLASKHGADLRYCTRSAKWLIWNGRYWQEDTHLKIEQLGKAIIDDIYARAEASTNGDESDELIHHAKRTESANKIKAMIDLARSEVASIPEDFDRDIWLFNAANVTINLRNIEVMPHTREHFLTKISGVEYDESADCPQWMKFLNEIFNENQELISYVQRCVGYCLTGDCTEQCFFLLYGMGANGKSTFVETIHALLADYAETAEFSTFLTSYTDRPIRNDIAKLRGARFVSAVEANAGRKIDEAVIKSLTGNERITARFLRQEFFQFKPEFKIWLAANHKPEIHSADYSIWRRVRLIPFEVTFSPERQDKDLAGKLQEELSGILNWALEGCRQWQDKGLQEPVEIVEATAEYKDEMDVLSSFLTDCVTESPEENIKAVDLFITYEGYCGDQKTRPITETTFAKRCSEHGLKKKRKGSGVYYIDRELTTHGKAMYENGRMLRNNPNYGRG